MPQDYVNYVKMSWVDELGVKHPIYPTNNLTTSPYYTLHKTDEVYQFKTILKQHRVNRQKSTKLA